jgi:Tol biopolymer transport system component
MMKTTWHNLFIIAGILPMLFFLGCGSKGNEVSESVKIEYPPFASDSGASVFLPGIVSTDSLEFGSAFSPDGRSFYFARSVDKKSKIYVTHHDGKNWTPATAFPFTTSNYSEADPAFSPDGKLYFISNRPVVETDSTSDYDIWFVTPLGEGGWTAPKNLHGINSDSSEYYISFSKNGNLYFASAREGGFGEEDIYRSRLVSGEYGTPENLGDAINTMRSEYDPSISPGENLLVFTSSKRDDTFGGADLYCTTLDKDKNWEQPIHLDSTFNTKTREYCPYFSPDSKFLFFSSEGDVKWVSVSVLKK